MKCASCGKLLAEEAQRMFFARGHRICARCSVAYQESGYSKEFISKPPRDKKVPVKFHLG
ncbi:hypothetical protein KBB60_02195 [Patescibacteria group bacterium]|nr:hypothetical protein [Patescibacteria group bacterium]